MKLIINCKMILPEVVEKTVSQAERAWCLSEGQTSEAENERKFLVPTVVGMPTAVGTGKFDSVFSKQSLAVKFFLIITILFPPTTFAATEFLTSWQANSYVPYFYQGKALPSPNSTVTVSFEVISNGRPLDISGRSVRWYLDNQLYQSGVSLKAISFKTDFIKQTDYQVKISLPKFSNGKDLEEFLTIPLSSPEVVIDAPYYNGLISSGINLLRGLLYFFNTRGLREIDLFWTANSQKTTTPTGVPDILELQVPAGSSGNLINIGLTAKNTKNELEFGNTSVNLNVK